MSSSISPSKRLRSWIELERRDIWVIVIYSAAVGLLSLVVPIATQSLVNTIAFGALLQPLVVLSLLVFLGLAFSALLKVLRSHVVEILQRRIFVRVSQQSLERLLRVRMDAFDDGHGPELVNRFFDVVTLQKSGATLLVEGLEVSMATLVGMILLTVYHPLLLVFALLLLACVAIVLFPLGSGAVPTAIAESKAKYALAAWLQEVARHPATFKTMQGASLALERGNGLVEDYLKYRGAHWRILLRQIVGSLTLQAFGAAGVLAAGGWLVMQRQLTLGQLIAAELVVNATLNGISKFGKQLETYYDLLAAVDKLGYLTDLPAEASGTEAPQPAGPATVELRQIDGLNLVIPAGARFGISGEPGSGKSTLADRIAGLRDPVSGSLLLNGQPYRNLERYELRGQIALVRGVEIFHGTVEENIRLANPSLSSAALRQILRDVGLLQALELLPDGLGTQLYTGGAPLTASEAYRLMLARALASEPRLLILDEPDPELIPTHLLEAKSSYTLILISRLPEVLRRCDTFLTLETKAVAQ